MKTTCYLQVAPTFFSWNADRLRSITVKRVTQRYPRDPLPGVVVVKLRMDIGDAAFLPLKPSVDVTIPVEHTEAITAVSEPIVVLDEGDEND